MPRRKRSDPPIFQIPTDPRTWPARTRAFGWAQKNFFARPQAPWSFDHGLAPEIVAACVVREVVLALEVGRFPERRWADWLTRRAQALYRIEKKFRARMDGADERAWCYAYMRHWLHAGLRRSGWRYARALPAAMWSGERPTRANVSLFKCSSLVELHARRRRRAG